MVRLITKKEKINNYNYFKTKKFPPESFSESYSYRFSGLPQLLNKDILKNVIGFVNHSKPFVFCRGMKDEMS